MIFDTQPEYEECEEEVAQYVLYLQVVSTMGRVTLGIVERGGCIYLHQKLVVHPVTADEHNVVRVGRDEFCHTRDFSGRVDVVFGPTRESIDIYNIRNKKLGTQVAENLIRAFCSLL